MVGQHVNDRRFANIRSANEGKFRLFCSWAFLEVCIANDKLCGMDDHEILNVLMERQNTKNVRFE
jgi:hypothetical protein